METQPEEFSATHPASRQEISHPGFSPHGFSHHGGGGELFAITLVNLLLKLVTLGIYHFWGKTKVRRYVWSRTHFSGEPFEYTGRGLELFIGYLIAMVVVVPLVAGFQVLPLLAEELPIVAGALGVALYPLVLFLTGFAAFSSRRYMLSRTRWRGIRFGLIGSARRHGLKLVFYSLLMAVSFGFYFPFMRNHLTAHMVNQAWFGDRRLSYEGKGSDLFRRFIAFWFICGGIVLVFALLLAGSAGLIFGLQRMEELAPILPVVFGIMGILVWIAIAVAWLWYKVGEYRYMVGKTRLGDVRFSLTAPTARLIWLLASNLLLLIFSLGFAYAWVVVRTVRFLCAHLALEGELDLNAIGQHPAGVPGTGEGLAEAFDIGSI